jgi:hypothetical protein
MWGDAPGGKRRQQAHVHGSTGHGGFSAAVGHRGPRPLMRSVLLALTAAAAGGLSNAENHSAACGAGGGCE